MNTGYKNMYVLDKLRQRSLLNRSICEGNWCWLISPQTGIETTSVPLQGTGAIIHQQGM